ncbi:MAG: head GIN domain-containing protein [Desulfobacterales bacterium]|jgi:hypothetical protein
MKIRFINLIGILIGVATMASGCIVIDLNGCSRETVKGSGDVVTEERQLPEFKTIKLKGIGRVSLTQGQMHSIGIQTDDNIMPLIETEVHADQLVISQGNYNLRPTTLEFNVTVAHLKGIAISGSGEVMGKSRFVSEDFYAKISGSGDVVLELDVKDLQTDISGSGSMNLAGQTNRHNASISGSGKINAFDMPARNVSLKVSGSGDCKINATETLDARISGAGDVIYTGRPRITSKISGSGKLESRD